MMMVIAGVEGATEYNASDWQPWDNSGDLVGGDDDVEKRQLE